MGLGLDFSSYLSTLLARSLKQLVATHNCKGLAVEYIEYTDLHSLKQLFSNYN